jgi:hypothetical protein
MIYAFDLGTQCGWARGHGYTSMQSGSIMLKQRGEPDWTAFTAWARWLQTVWTQEPPTVVVLEAMFSSAAFAARSSDASAKLQSGLRGVVGAFAGAWKITPSEYQRSTILAHFISNGRPGSRMLGKQLVVERCRLLKYVPRDCHDEDQCDALALLDYEFSQRRVPDVRQLFMFGERTNALPKPEATT